MISNVYSLIKRVLPNHYDQIVAEYISDDNGRDIYEIDFNNDKVVLKGNNNVSIALALGQYLKYTAHANLSWCGSDITLPEKLPVPAYERRVIEQKYRAYMNYCTFNYSASWWDFDRWEKEIDYMALCGINLPLCAIGIEGTWYYTLMEMGFSEDEARSFIAGPAFLAWQNMGNLESFGGCVSREWIESRIELGRKIIDRVVSLDMHPIQQGFSGCVSTLFKEKYPQSNIMLKKPWYGMSATAQIDPLDPLFSKLGKKFMEVEKRLFGLHGFYAADPFHESVPPVDGEDYLHKVGETISGLYADLDPGYTWVMQAWSLRKNIVEVVPKDKILLLDLNGVKHKKENFWGYPCVVGTLHNFGGRTKMHGGLTRIANNPYSVAKQGGANVVGTGLFMEGIGQNPMFYDLAFEMLTRSDTVDVGDWIKGYVYRRYKTDDARVLDAWDILLKTVYMDEEAGSLETSSVICARPAVDVRKSGPNAGFIIRYDHKELAKVIDSLLEAKCETDGYEYDLVDITRQYLSDYAYELYKNVARSFKEKDICEFDRMSTRFLELLSDLDRLLSQRSEFSLKKWITDARNCATSLKEQELFEYNATALVTIWGNDEESILFDYSWREWSGLIDQYYKMRWSFFLDKLRGFLENGIEYTEEGLPRTHDRETWRANALYSEMADLEVKWIRSEKTFKDYEIESVKEIVRLLLDKYLI